MTSFKRVSQKLVFHQSKCFSAIKHILSATAMYIFSSSFMYLCIPCYCDSCLKSNSALRVEVKRYRKHRLNTEHVKETVMR